VFEQKSLGIDAGGEAGERAVRANYAVTREHDRKRIPTVRRADRPNRLRPFDRGSLLGVGAGGAIRNVSERGPHQTLKGGSLVKVERNIERRASTAEVLVQLLGHTVEHGCVVGVFDGVMWDAEPNSVFAIIGPQHGSQAHCAGDERQVPQRGLDDQPIQHASEATVGRPTMQGEDMLVESRP